MQKRKLDNLDLDAIGKRLFAASRPTDSEIERIASAPGLFDGVLSRIRNAQTTEERKLGLTAFLFAHRTIAGTALAAVLCISAFAFFMQLDGTGPVFNTIHTPVERSDEARPNFTPQVKYVKGFTAGRADIELDVPAKTAEAPAVQHAIRRVTRKPRPRVEQTDYSQNNENQFVAVTYTGDGGESARGGRVVRVDVSRSTLFAMGFDVPLENDSPTVIADLLIGPDGLTRAVRLVE